MLYILIFVKRKPKMIMVPGNKIFNYALSVSTMSHQIYQSREHIARSYSSLTHVDNQGKAAMVDVGTKEPSVRVAHARAYIYIGPVICRLIMENNVKKGDVLTIAQLAGIIAAKKTSDLIPLCHPLMLNCVNVDLKINEDLHRVVIDSEVKCRGKTGVEMEALTAVSIAALTVYDMCKSAASPDTMHIFGIELISKVGGTRGDFHRK